MHIQCVSHSIFNSVQHFSSSFSTYSSHAAVVPTRLLIVHPPAFGKRVLIHDGGGAFSSGIQDGGGAFSSGIQDGSGAFSIGIQDGGGAFSTPET